MTARDETPDVALSEEERRVVLARIKWRLDHYGPPDAEPFQFSRYESPAHAALSAVEEFIAARVAASEAARAEAEARVAAAWDEGYASGHSNAMRQMSDEPNAATTPNPYLVGEG